MKKSLWQIGMAAACMAQAGFAAIQYNAERNIIWVTDYPESFPCSMDRVLKADRLRGWGVVTHDPANDTYTVNAELRIGTDTGSATYFQIGDSQHVKPTIIMAKDLVLMNGKSGRKGNMLSIGNPQDNAIAPVLRFAAARGLYGGVIPAAEKQPKDRLGRTFASNFVPGAEIEIYNTLITCAQPDQKFGVCSLVGVSVVLKNTRILRSSESLYVYSNKKPVIENVVFEDSTKGLNNFRGLQGWLVKGCVFRNCRTAVLNPHNVIFQDCRFENNVRNWELNESGGKAGFLDCAFGAPQKENETGIGGTTLKGTTVEISVSAAFEVKDSRGNPVANARVAAHDAKNQLEQHVFSDKAGKAILALVEKKIMGTDDVAKPAVMPCSYALSVSAEKFKTMEIPSIDLNDKSIRPVVLAAIE